MAKNDVKQISKQAIAPLSPHNKAIAPSSLHKKRSHLIKYQQPAIALSSPHNKSVTNHYQKFSLKQNYS
jgi:hypothetical protein